MRRASHPGREFVFIFNDREVEVAPDFSHTVRTHWLVEARGPKGGLLGPIEVAPFVGRDEFGVEWAVKIGKGGRYRLKSVEDVKFALKGKPTYLVQRIVVPLPFLGPGERLDICFVLRRVHPLIPGHFFITHVAQRREPVKRAKFVLKAPKSIRYLWRAYGPKPKVIERIEGERSVRTFEWENLPPWRGGEEAARVVVGTAASWGPILEWLRGLFEPKVVVDRSIKDLARKLTEGKGRGEKIEALWRFVTKQMIPVLSPSPFEPLPAPEVLRRRAGDCKDKAVLLLALLKAAGVEGASLRFAFGGYPEPPNPHALYHVLVEVDGRLLDPFQGAERDWRAGAKLLLRM